ncbi:MAG: hypothetical protein AAB484_01770 [Patescibacteria group bacterium]
MFSNEVKNKAISLRKTGQSINEISHSVKISKSTLSIWLRGIILSLHAKNRIERLKIEGNKRAGLTLSKKRIIREVEASEKAKETLRAIPTATKQQKKLMCALIYYCEGEKSIKHGMTFTNSSSELMRIFLSLLRDGFNLDESRFRVCVHLHSYHDEKTQKTFWSNITDIPQVNFIKSYIKKEGGINKRVGYQGCATVRYHDAAIGRELLEIARQYFRIIK